MVTLIAAQLAEQLLPITKLLSSNAVIAKIL